MSFEQEVASIQVLDLDIWDITLVCISASGNKYRILGTPENNERCLSDDNIGQNKMSTAVYK